MERRKGPIVFKKLGPIAKVIYLLMGAFGISLILIFVYLGFSGQYLSSPNMLFTLILLANVFIWSVLIFNITIRRTFG